MTTFVAIAENSKLAFENLDIKATGKMDKKDGKYMMTEITLYPELVITDNTNSEKAKRIMEKAEAACLISRSVKTEIKLEPKVIIGSLS